MSSLYLLPHIYWLVVGLPCLAIFFCLIGSPVKKLSQATSLLLWLLVSMRAENERLH